jgi:NAD(P)-dependent dehydrogenase (short-subunit alcohol dehydrogenase family)
MEFRTFLVTGATDGIGLYTVKMLAKYAPEAKKIYDRRIIAIHGKNPKKIREIMTQLNSDPNKDNFQVVSFCFDLANVKQVQRFIDQVLLCFPGDGKVGKKDNKNMVLGQLDCIVNNAGLFDSTGPHESVCGRYEKTFMVNVVAPYLIT